MLTFLGKRKLLDLGDGITCRPFSLKRVASKFELLVYVREDEDDIELEAEFNTDLFQTATIERMMRHYVHLLERLSIDIDVEISRVSFLPDAEKTLILDVWNDTSVDYPSSTVVDMFEAQAEKTPEAIAVEFGDRSLTYDGLNRVANQVARVLRGKQKDRAGPFVGVYMERSLEMVVALLAIVKAGYAYVPIDPDYPGERIRFMIEDSELPLILTQEPHRSALRDVSAEIVVLSDLEARAEDAVNLARDLSPDSSVYMIYTSGSTGRPKGVINRHGALFNRLYWMQSMYGLTPDDRVLQKTPFSFDVSVWEFFWPLMFGARIVVAEPGGHRDADYLRRVIFEKRITTLHFVPSMLNVFLEEDDLAASCVSLRRVFCSGEALPYKSVEGFFERLPCELHNLYGPTEAAIDVSFWPCSVDYPGKIVPIGKPIANVKLYVVDKHMQLQPIGVPGELCIGGVALASGYHNRNELTEKAFVGDPFAEWPDTRLYRTGDLARYRPDGQIEYLGRIDTQIKLRGFRIELGEIEAEVKSLPSVREATVVLHETRTNRMLVAYVVASDFDQRGAKELLRKSLPDFMVPQVFVELPRIPTNANGKLDRKALPDPFAGLQTDDAASPPTSTEEEILIRIWRDVLGVDRVGADSNFFRLGGDSISSVRIAARLRELGYAMEVQDIFMEPTVCQFARVMTTRRREVKGLAETPFCLIDGADREGLADGVKDAWPLTMLQAGMIYHSMLQEKTPVYHDIFAFDIEAPIHPEYLFEAFRAVVARHPQLRSAFDLNSFSQPLQIVYADPVVPLEIADVTHLSRQQQEDVIEAWIAAEKERDFDVERGPLFRIQVHVRSQDEMNLAVAFHHVILDGWSFAVVLDEFRRVYAGLLRLDPVPPRQERVPYSAYVNLERQALRDPAQAAFWLQRVRDVPAAALPLSYREGSVEQHSVLASTDRVVPERVASALQRLAGEFAVPLKSVFLALHLHVLARIAGRRQVVSGLVVNGRPEMQGSEELVGLFLNTIPFPIDLLEESWPSFVKRVFELEQEIVAYRRFPLAEIQKRARATALFDVVFNYTDFQVSKGRDDVEEVGIKGARYFEQTNYDAVVHAHRDLFSGEMRLIFNYDAVRLDGQLIERYMDNYLEAAADLTSNAPLVSRYPKATAMKAAAREDRGRGAPARTAATVMGMRAAPVAPRTLLEQQIAGIVSQAIGIESMGIDDNYLELGVDSITAIRIVARMRKLAVELALQDVFGCQTVRRLAEQAEAGRAAATAGSRRVQAFELAGGEDLSFPPSVVDAYPATSMQLDMICQGADAEQAIYHDVFSYRLALLLDEARLRDSLGEVVNAHDTFRTAFALEGYSVPMQLVYDAVRPHVETFDISALNAEQQQARFDEWFEREKCKSFDWSRPGLIRFYVHKRGPTDFTLTLSFHHAIIDGWSLSLFVQDVLAMYIALLRRGGARRPTVPALKYRDYVRAEVESRRSDLLRSFWHEKLQGYTYNALPRPAKGSRGSRWSETKIALDEARQEGLTRLSNRLGVPLKHTMLACHLRVMGLVCGASDVLTGVFTSGRLEEDGGDNVLGMFLNFMPFRQGIGGQTWRRFIEETFENDNQSLAYRRYPLGDIQRDLGQERLLETAFNYTHFKSYGELARAEHRGGPNAVLRDVRWFEHTNFFLLANVGRDLRQERLTITLNAHGRVLPQSHVEVVVQLYDAVLAQIVDQPDARVRDVPRDVADLLVVLGERNLALSGAGAQER
jgi:amino acid adenylation domain-containing protein